MSVDGGKTWTKVSGDDGTSGSGFITNVEDKGSYYAFTYAGGTINVPKYIEGLSFTYTTSGEGEEAKPITNGELYVQPNETFTINVASMGGRWDFETSTPETKATTEETETNDWKVEKTTDGKGLSVTAPSTESSIVIDFTFVAADNKVTEYQIKLTSLNTQIDKTENENLVSALEDLGLGEKDAEGNLTITPEEIQKTTELNLSNQELTSLEGLEVFTNLTKLECSSNQITELSLEELPNLTYLDCSENSLTELDLSETTSLTYLNCSGNPLTTVNFESLTELETLLCNNCFNNSTTRASIDENGKLDLSANTKLQSVECSQNGLTQLILPDVPNLTSLYCSENKLTSIDISKQTNLNVLDISSNELTALDVAANKELLRVLTCSYNALTELDITLCTNLEALNCQGNQMTKLNALHNTKLETLGCGLQQTADGADQQLELILPESLMTLWETQWQNESANKNVTVSDGTLKPGASGEDFGNGGVY